MVYYFVSLFFFFVGEKECLIVQQPVSLFIMGGGVYGCCGSLLSNKFYHMFVKTAPPPQVGPSLPNKIHFVCLALFFFFPPATPFE